MTLNFLRLKKREDLRLRTGHLWIYSNEVDTASTPLKNFTPGQIVNVENHAGHVLGSAYMNPHSLICARLFSHTANQLLDRNFLTQKIAAALAWRSRLFAKPFYRLIFGESDGLPGLVVDRFDKTLVVQITTAGMEAAREEIIAALKAVLTPAAILLRNDSSQRTLEGLELSVTVAFGIPPERVVIEENSTQFFVPLHEGQKTGWFYDHRFNRARLKDYVRGQRVLDVFSYLGAWGIQAATFGATEITCIDSSASACALIQENAALNHLENKVRVLHDDAFVALKNLRANNAHFDVVILDPPAFIKKQKDLKEGMLAYQRLNELALRILKPNGILVSSSCSMHLKKEDLQQLIHRASLRTDSELQLLERGQQSPDHPIHLAIPETEYLKMLLLRKG